MKINKSGTFSLFSFITISVEMEIVLQEVNSKLIVRQKACILKTKHNPIILSVCLVQVYVPRVQNKYDAIYVVHSPSL
jgi:hypothetical protein